MNASEQQLHRRVTGADVSAPLPDSTSDGTAGLSVNVGEGWDRVELRLIYTTDDASPAATLRVLWWDGSTRTWTHHPADDITVDSEGALTFETKRRGNRFFVQVVSLAAGTSCKLEIYYRLLRARNGQV